MEIQKTEDSRRSNVGQPEESVQTLQHMNQELEARVQERTALYELANAALQESEARLRTVIGNAKVVLFALNREGVFTLAEGKGLEDLGIGSAEFVGRSALEMFAQLPDAVDNIRRALAGESTTTFVGINVTFEARLSPVRDDEGNVTGVIGVATDITERRRAESLLAGQRQVLESIATGTPLTYILDDLVHLLEGQISGMICSILRVTPEEDRLAPAAAGSLPPEYVQGLADGVPIEEGAGSCGTAAHRRQPVIVSNIASDALWDDYRELALSHDLRACWSAPIFSTSGVVLGTFAAYYREERAPDEETSRLVQIATRIAGIAIERSQAEGALRESEELLKAIVESTADGILVVNNSGQVIYANELFAKMWRIPEELLETRDDEKLLSHVVEQLEDPEGFLAKVQELYQTSQEGSDVLSFKDGRVFERFSRPLLTEIDVIGRVWSFRDITERKRVEEALREAANRDPLTGLPNRRAGTAAIGERLAAAKENGSAFAVMVLDLDRFKKINDSFGHETGDAALIQFSDVISKLVGDSGEICRIGGDEFNIGIEKMEMEAALAFAQRIHSTLRYTLERSDSALRPQFTVSIGVACYPEDGADASVLGRRADRAMYEAKVAGCDTTRAWRDVDSSQAA